MLISDRLIEEVVRTLSKPYFLDRVDRTLYRDTLEALMWNATLVEISSIVSGVASHPEDDLVLSTATSASADYLVTGDRQLRRVDMLHGTSIATPNEFRSILEQI